MSGGMKKNTRKKGNDFQRRCAGYLKDWGWTVRNFPVTVQPIRIGGRRIFATRPIDIWGSDMVARKDRPSIHNIDSMIFPRLIWVQASLSGGVKKRIEDFKASISLPLPGEEFQIWLVSSTGSINVKQVDVQTGVAIDLGKIIKGSWFGKAGYRF